VHFYVFLLLVLFSTDGQLDRPLPFLVPTNNRSYWMHTT